MCELLLPKCMFLSHFPCSILTPRNCSCCISQPWLQEKSNSIILPPLACGVVAVFQISSTKDSTTGTAAAIKVQRKVQTNQGERKEHLIPRNLKGCDPESPFSPFPWSMSPTWRSSAFTFLLSRCVELFLLSTTWMLAMSQALCQPPGWSALWWTR